MFLTMPGRTVPRDRQRIKRAARHAGDFSFSSRTLVAFDNLKHTIKVIDNVHAKRTNRSAPGL